MGEAIKKRVISGMRPTGRLHIGHYFGALQNWVRLQNDPSYECFYFIADWHALTSDYADTSAVSDNVIQIATDYLAAGLVPGNRGEAGKSVIFLQSQVPEHAELHLLLSMVTPLGWLERVPTYKEALENIKDKDLHTYGFLGYPVLQTADIVIYSAVGADGTAIPLVVPVGEDQVSHVELSREIVRRFNLGFQRIEIAHYPSEEFWYGLATKIGYPLEVTSQLMPAFPGSVQQKKRIFLDHFNRAPLSAKADYLSAGLREAVSVVPVLEQPEAMLTATPRIPGLDGRKMSKSYGNAITLSESDAEIRAKTKVMVTDPARKRRTDPGNPDICPVYDWHKLFAAKTAEGAYTAEGQATLDWAAHGCRTAGIGCIECKAAMADNLIRWIAPVRERRVEYEKHPGRVMELVDAGSKRARVEAVKTMARVREAVFHWKQKREEISGLGA